MNYNHKSDFPSSMMNKYERLEKLKNERKIIIAGGSSSSYSINSTELQKRFKLPVVNTSLAMSLGSDFHLNITTDYLSEGDVILYIPEYEFYYGRQKGDDFLYTTAFYYPKIVKDYTLQQQKELFVKSVKLSFDYFKGSFIKLFEDSKKTDNKIDQYSRGAFNQLGDNISLLNEKKTLIKPSKRNRYQKLKNNHILSTYINKLKEFNNICKSHGVKFIIGFPPLEKSQFSSQFNKDVNYIKNSTDLCFIGTPEEDVYSKDFFYDTSYHLLGKGREIRTNKLIKNLLKEKVFN